MFEESWLRLVLKQATGTGKTKVLSLLIAWCYFHKEFNKNSELSKNFLLLAPNTIVLDRLKDDIEGLSVFNNDPIIPPNQYDGRNWNFYPKVHIQDNIGTLSKNGNIFLTNIQRFVTRSEQNEQDNSIDYFLGDNPVKKTTDNKILVRDIVNNIDDIIGDKDSQLINLVDRITKYDLALEINNMPIIWRFDTGAETTSVSFKQWDKIKANINFEDLNIKRTTQGVGGTSTGYLVKILDDIKIGEYSVKNFIVCIVENDFSLLGIDFLQKFSDVQWNMKEAHLLIYK